jgi:hypothetical protein
MTGSLALQQGLRGHASSVQAAAYSGKRCELIAIDSAGLHLFSLQREVKCSAAHIKKASALFACSIDALDLWIVMHSGRGDDDRLSSEHGAVRALNARLQQLAVFQPLAAAISAAAVHQATATLLLADNAGSITAFTFAKAAVGAVTYTPCSLQLPDSALQSLADCPVEVMCIDHADNKLIAVTDNGLLVCSITASTSTAAAGSAEVQYLGLQRAVWRQTVVCASCNAGTLALGLQGGCVQVELAVQGVVCLL